MKHHTCLPPILTFNLDTTQRINTTHRGTLGWGPLLFGIRCTGGVRKGRPVFTRLVLSGRPGVLGVQLARVGAERAVSGVAVWWQSVGGTKKSV